MGASRNSGITTMPALITADLHLSDNPRDEYRFTALSTIRNIAKAEKVSRVIVLGDLTEAKDKHGARLVNRIVNEFDKLATVCDVMILKGNHDYVVEDDPFFAFLSRIPDISFINNPTEFPIKGLGHCLFLPHTRDWQRDWSGIELTGNDWVFAHNTFEGADVGGRTMPGIPVEQFGKDRDYVITGDVHVPQRIGPVTYVGSPSLVDFGDDYEPRVLLIEEGKRPISIPVPGPQKRLIEIKILMFGTSVISGIWNKGDIVKVRVNLDAGDYAQWAEIRQHVKAWGDEEGLILHTIQPIVREGKSTIKRTVRAPRSDEELLQSYVKLRAVDEATAGVGMKLLQEA
jgi:hypothetical protein